MAASTPSGDDEMITGINVTPLVDIILVLLIIFMVTANLINRPSIEVDLPQAATGEGAEPTTVALTLTEEGALFLNGTATDEARLRPTLAPPQTLRRPRRVRRPRCRSPPRRSAPRWMDRAPGWRRRHSTHAIHRRWRAACALC